MANFTRFLLITLLAMGLVACGTSNARVNDQATSPPPAPAPSAPAVSISPSPSSGSAPLTVNFSAKVSGATASSYKWSFGDGTTSTEALPTHVYQTGGNYTSKVTVTDTAGGTATASSQVAVSGTAPSTPTVSISANPSSGSAPLSVNFTAKVSGATASNYQWSFGDGATSTDALPSHVYQTAGNYTSKVTVTDTAGGTASASTMVAVSGTSSEVKLRVVQANIQYGGHGTDNIINLNRTTDWLVKLNADVASLTEVIGGYNDPSLITDLMKQKTGLTWYNYYVPKFPGCAEGVMILSKWPIESTAQYFMSYQMPIAEANISVNGKLISFFATHFQWPGGDSSERQVEANQLVSFASKFSEPRIIAGDLNAQVGTPEVDIILQDYFGGWDSAVGNGLATSYPDNPPSLDTRTRRSRIDHIMYSKAASGVSVTGAEIPDQRASNTASLVVIKIGTTDDLGVRPSDHNFMEVTLSVN